MSNIISTGQVTANSTSATSLGAAVYVGTLDKSGGSDVYITTTAAVFLGGSTVTALTGLLLNPSVAPTRIPVPNVDELYVITNTGSATVSWLLA
jgi:hypothetical protein